MSDAQSPKKPARPTSPPEAESEVPTAPENDVSTDPPGGRGFSGKLLARVDQLRLARIVFGIVSLGVSIGYTVGAAGMPLGSPQQPGPGTWPLAVGSAWIVISLIIIGEAAFTKQVAGVVDLPWGIYGRDVIAFGVATVVYVVALPFIGQYIAGSIYCIAVVRLLGRVKWWKAVVYGLVMAIGISWIFLNLLLVRLPEGELLKLLGI